MFRSLPLFALALSTSASAGIYTGMPDMTFTAGRHDNDLISAIAEVDGVRIHNCGGGYTDYGVGDTVDLVKGFTITINGGNLCAAEIFWDSDIYITGGGFTLKSSPSSTIVDLDPLAPGYLNPFSVVSGTMPNPENAPYVGPSVD